MNQDGMNGMKSCNDVSFRDERYRATEVASSPPTPDLNEDSFAERSSKKTKSTAPTARPASNNVTVPCAMNSSISDHQVPHEMSREASLRALQLIRMQSQIRLHNEGNREQYERQSAPSSMPAISLDAPMHRYSYPHQGFHQNTLPLLFQEQNDLTFQVSQYLQMQANKHRYPGQVSLEQCSGNGLLQSRDYRLPNLHLAPRATPSSHMYTNNHFNDMQQFYESDNAFRTDMSSTRQGMPEMMGMAAPHGVTMIREGEVSLSLPIMLARPVDVIKVSSHQVLLRQQIEAFQATEEDVSTHTRGRNKSISLGQVGIRCRHCAHVPVLHRQKGSTYFPATTMGLYQAAQNMSTTHIQCGLCNHMPLQLKAQFAHIMALKSTNSGAGRPYWAESAKQLGLVDTEGGIFFVRNMPPGAVLLDADNTKAVITSKK